MTDLRNLALKGFIGVALLLSTGAFAPLWTDPTNPDTAINGNSFLQWIWIGIYVAVGLLLVRHVSKLRELVFANALMVALLLLCIASASWSDHPEVTLRKSAALLGTTALGCLLSLQFEPSEQEPLFAVVFGVAAISSLVAASVAPSMFPPSECAPAAWNGVFSHKNLLGRTMCLGALASLMVFRGSVRTRCFAILGGSLCFSLMVASHSRTGLLVFVALVLSWGLMAILKLQWRQAIGIGLLAGMSFLAIVCMILLRRGEIATWLGRTEDLTGRTKIWDFAMASIAHRPWLGYGYGGFWWVSDQSRQVLALIGYPTPHAHNALLDVWLQLGVLGVILLVGVYCAAFSDAIRYATCRDECQSGWPLLYLLFTSFYSFTESAILAPNSILWVLFVASCVTTSQHRQVRLQIQRRLHMLILPQPATLR